MEYRSRSLWTASTEGVGSPSMARIRSPGRKPVRGRRPAFRQAGDQDTRRQREAEASSQPPIDRLRLPGEAEVAADDPPLAQQLGHHPFRGVDGHGKADPLGAADDRRRDADHTAGTVHQRTAAVARIERGIGLDDVLDQAAGHAAERATQGADHARGDGRLEPEWVADRDHQLTYPKPLGMAEGRRRQAAAGKAQEREIGTRIFAHDPGLDASAVGEDGLKPRRARTT
jgi:hypothetical protein